MVELSRVFNRERLQRQPSSATLVGVPALPRVPDESGLYAQAGATFARGLQALSETMSAIDYRNRKLREAQETAQTAEQVGNFHLGMAPIQQRMVEQNIPALDRPTYLREQGQALIDSLVEQVPTRTQTAFKAQATQDLGRFVLAEQSRATQQFVDEQKTALPALLALVGQQLVTADDRQRPGIEQSLTAIATSFAEAGAVSAPLASALVRETIDKTTTQKAQNAIVAQPQTMLTHLQQLAAGKPGVEGMPVPPAKDLPALVGQAQSQVRQDLERVDREERRAAYDQRQIQDATMGRLQARLYQPSLNAQEVQRIEQETNRLTQQRQLRPEDQGTILRETRTLQQTLAQGPQQSDPGLKTRVITNLYGGQMGSDGMDALKEEILQGMLDGKVNLKDGQEWLQELKNQRTANYYTSIPAYQEGKQFLDRTVNYLADYKRNPQVNQEALARLESKSAYALQEYSREMRLIWQQGGVAAVEAQAPEVARRVMRHWAVTPREVLDYFPEPAPLRLQPPGLPLEERYTNAYNRLHDAPMPDADKAELYRILRSRQALEEEVIRSEAAEEQRAARERQQGPGGTGRAPVPPPAPPPPTPPPPRTPAQEVEQQKWRMGIPGQRGPKPP